MRESKLQKQKRVAAIIRTLKKKYPAAKCALNFSNPFELLAATILSAQCTDIRVNMVTPRLFARYPNVKSYADADQNELSEIIRSTGFYQNKAKHIIGAARRIEESFNGKVPADLESLTSLPGVGRKTANVILGNVFGIPGLTVDTHMIRLNGRLGFTGEKDPVKIEYDLMPLVPEKEWTLYSHLIIHHGRDRCFARKPDCRHCEISKLCPSAET